MGWKTGDSRVGFGAERLALGGRSCIPSGLSKDVTKQLGAVTPTPARGAELHFNSSSQQPESILPQPPGLGGGAGCAGSGCGAGAGWERAGRVEPIAGPTAGPIAGPIAVLLAECPGERALPTPRRHRACCRPRLAAGRGAPFCCMAFFFFFSFLFAFLRVVFFFSPLGLFSYFISFHFLFAKVERRGWG